MNKNPYIKFIFLIIILLSLFFITSFAKIFALYHPIAYHPIKYQRFYHKLKSLVENPDYIIKAQVPTPDKLLLDSIFIKNPDTSRCIIYFHGNSGNISMRFDMIKKLYNYASVLIFDYRSYGKSQGTLTDLSEKALVLDGKTIWTYANLNLGFKSDTITFFGESLGCSIALKLASELKCSRITPHSLILNSPFYSLKTMISHVLDGTIIRIATPIVSLMYGREYKTHSHLASLNPKIKIIIAHSSSDEIIPYEQGYDLYFEAKKTVPSTKFITISGTHEKLGLTDEYFYAISDMLA